MKFDKHSLSTDWDDLTRGTREWTEASFKTDEQLFLLT